MNSSTNKLSNKISWFFKLESNSHKEINYVYGVKQSEISITRHHSVLSLRQKTHTRWNTANQIKTWWEHFAITRPLGTKVSCNCLIWLIQIIRHLFNDNIKKDNRKVKFGWFKLDWKILAVHLCNIHYITLNILEFTLQAPFFFFFFWFPTLYPQSFQLETNYCKHFAQVHTPIKKSIFLPKLCNFMTSCIMQSPILLDLFPLVNNTSQIWVPWYNSYFNY